MIWYWWVIIGIGLFWVLSYLGIQKIPVKHKRKRFKTKRYKRYAKHGPKYGKYISNKRRNLKVDFDERSKHYDNY